MTEPTDCPAPDAAGSSILPDIPDRELLRRAVMSARDPTAMGGLTPAWLHINWAFALGSTDAKKLCEHFDLEPEEMVRR